MKARYGIRKARAEDLEGILGIEVASFGREAYDRKLFAYYLRRAAGLFLVAEHGGHVCGYLIGCLRGGAAELVSVAVNPAFRGRGAGAELLESFLRRLTYRRIARLRLIVREDNVPARAFYEKYGFRRLRRVPRYYEDGGDGIAMWRPVISR